MRKAILYIHGKNGAGSEIIRYGSLFSRFGYDVYSLDLPGHGKSEKSIADFTPWGTSSLISEKFKSLINTYESVAIFAVSIGAYFTMHALENFPCKPSFAFFVSPIVNMENLISNMMSLARVSEVDLRNKGEIRTTFGETLSFKYLSFVRENPISWNVETSILYGDGDNLTPIDILNDFVSSHKVTLTIMKNGEHYFHTKEELDFMDAWLERSILDRESFSERISRLGFASVREVKN